MLLTICSGKGGVGKSVLSSNIAYQIAAMGSKVLLIDTDLMFPNLHLLFGIDPPLRLDDWLYKRATLDRVIVTINKNLSIIAGSISAEDGELVENFSFVDLYHEILLETDFDCVIVDTNAGVSNSLVEAASISDIVGVVVTDEPTSIVDAYGLTKILLDYCDTEAIKLLLNNVIDEEDAREIKQKLNKAMKHFLNITVDTLGSVPYDSVVRKSIVQQQLLSEMETNSEVITAINRIARVVMTHIETPIIL
ncbi:MAG: P-loop NTPase [Ignavibacteria bacterium]|jgi:flagellar biosynthesis protein FlhG|nr:P-loop NTPase [Ignavibacteria bacterium]